MDEVVSGRKREGVRPLAPAGRAKRPSWEARGLTPDVPTCKPTGKSMGKPLGKPMGKPMGKP
jgi:hypothetical protein